MQNSENTADVIGMNFAGNADCIRICADFLVSQALLSKPFLTLAFHPAVDDVMRADVASRTDRNQINFRTFIVDGNDFGNVSSAIFVDENLHEEAELLTSVSSDTLLILKYPFYGKSRDSALRLLTAIPQCVNWLLIIDQTDGFNAEASSVLSLTDGGGRHYEAECHDIAAMLGQAGFRERLAVDLPDPVKSLSGVVLASRKNSVMYADLSAHCTNFAEKMKYQRRVSINEQRKHRISQVRAPRRLILEPSSQCNFMCPKCVYPFMERTKGLVDIPKMEAFLDAWVAEIGPFELIDLTGSGDVLVNRQLHEIISLVTKKMPTSRVSASTNLALLNEATADRLLDAGLRYWQVSFDSADPDEFHRFTKSKKFHTVLANIKMLFAKMNARQDGPFDLTIVAHRPFDEHYESGMSAIRDLLKGHCHGISCTPYQSLNGRIAGEVYRASEVEFYSKELTPVVCNYLWDDLVVVHTGDVRLCCSDMFDSKIKFGNIFENSPRQLIDNLDRQIYQKHMMAGEVDKLYLCKDCHSPYAPV